MTSIAHVCVDRNAQGSWTVHYEEIGRMNLWSFSRAELSFLCLLCSRIALLHLNVPAFVCLKFWDCQGSIVETTMPSASTAAEPAVVRKWQNWKALRFESHESHFLSKDSAHIPCWQSKVVHAPVAWMPSTEEQSIYARMLATVALATGTVPYVGCAPRTKKMQLVTSHN